MVRREAADTSETFRWVGGGDNLSLSTAKHNSDCLFVAEELFEDHTLWITGEFQKTHKIRSA